MENAGGLDFWNALLKGATQQGKLTTVRGKRGAHSNGGCNYDVDGVDDVVDAKVRGIF